MKIAFFGAGRAGLSLYLFFRKKGLEVRGIYSRRGEKALEDLEETDQIKIVPFESLREADVIIITVEDKSIEIIADTL
ncbi:MAG: NAD(P)-binding domain-containing protein, partial [Thermosulfidibacteraceae bacterium]